MSAPYFLAIDIGTTRTSAATARSAPDGSLMAAAFPLGRASDNAPTVTYAADGDLLFGDAAERRGASHPERLIREFKRRIGDDVPIVAADRAYTPEELFARTVDWAARAVVEREGATPAGLAVTIPAAWGEYRSDIVRAALADHGWREVTMLTEPEAAARHYAATHPLSPGEALAVYDFGGGTFDAVVLRSDPDGTVRAAGPPSGIPDLGGADFDDLLVRHVLRTAHVDASDLVADAAGRLALGALRRECVEAKESLSFDSEAVIPVLVAGEHTAVRLSRDEFEGMIADDLERTVAALDTALADAGVAPEQIGAILLTGGSSRIPRVAQLLSEHFDRPIAIDADPKAIIALGAARAAADAASVPPSTSEDASAIPEEAPAALALADAPRTAVAPRRWFRRAPRTAWAAAGFTLLATGAALAMAPTLGMGVVSASERAAMTAAPVAEAADATDGPAPAPAPPAAAPPADDTSASPAPAPRGPGKAPGVSPKASPSPSPRAVPPSPNRPAATTPPGTSGGPAAADSSTPSGTSPTPAAPTPAPAGPGASTPSPTPDPVDPAPVDPGPVDPGPVDPDPVDPGPSDPDPADPAPEDPAPEQDPAPTGAPEPPPGDAPTV